MMADATIDQVVHAGNDVVTFTATGEVVHTFSAAEYRMIYALIDTVVQDRAAGPGGIRR